MTDLASLQADLAAAAGSDRQSLAEVAEAIDRFVFDGAEFPQPLFDQVLAVMRSASWRARPDSLALVKMFEFELDLLTPEQREALAAAMLDALPQLADETAAFLAVEFLVDLWPAERALAALSTLAAGAGEPLLLTYVHGLDWLAKRCADTPEVHATCLARLRELSSHRLTSVVAEARAALRRRAGK